MSSSSPFADSPLEVFATAEDPFRFGTRWQRLVKDDGTEEVIPVPLKLEDFLDPEEGDEMTQGDLHDRMLSLLKDILRRHLERDPMVAVFSDLKMLWGIPGLKRPSPDFAVVRDFDRTAQALPSFDVEEAGTRPCLVIEVTSPTYRHMDLREKVAIYERAGIAEYLIIDMKDVADGEPSRILGYRLGASGRYRPMTPDAEGGIRAETVAFVFAPAPELADGIKIVNAETGERLLSAEEARQRAEERTALAELRAASSAGRAVQADQRAMEARERAAVAKKQTALAEEQATLARAEAKRERDARRALEAELERLRAKLEEQP